MSTDRRAPRLVLVATLLLALLSPVLSPAAPAAAQTAPSWAFKGGGWGHGVGMSQWGARGMAARGVGHGAILGHYYRNTAVQTLPSAGNIRVLVGETSGKVTFTPTSQVKAYLNGFEFWTYPANQPFEVQRNGNKYHLSGKGDVGGDPGDVVDLLWAGQSPVRVSTTNHRYRFGQLRLRLRGADTLRVVLENLTMQQYLYGLAEVPASWPTEALRAQAIAARSYAQNRIAMRRNSGEQFDVFATTQDQVYSGFEKDGSAGVQPWIDAVNATNDRFVTYNGNVIDAFYFSTSGGHTENSENVFVATLPYLKGVPDPDDAPSNSLHSWSRTYSQGQLSAWFGAHADTNVGTVSSIRIIGPTGVSGRVDKGDIEIVGSAGTKRVKGARFRQVINAAVGGGLANQLPSTKFTVAQANAPRPFGSFDELTRAPGGLVAKGWVIDPGSTAPAVARVTVNGALAAQESASRNRPDVGRAYPAYGSNHGYELRVGTRHGHHRVCAEGVGQGGAVVLACRNATVDGTSWGNFENVRPAPGGVTVTGWAIDPDTADPINVHLYLDGRWAGSTRAAGSRPDVGGFFRNYGNNHGFQARLGVGPGRHTVCAYAIDAGSGPNPSIGCRTFTRASAPFGSLDTARTASGGIAVTGWAIDPDTSNPIGVHIYVNGRFAAALTANGARRDVGGAYPGFGDHHGFSATVPGGSGSVVCAYGINVPSGSNPVLGTCRRA